VKVIIGIVNDKSEAFIAFMNNIIATTLSDPPTNRATQNWLVNLGMPMKKSIGSKNTNEKNINEHATTYSSISLRLFFEKTSFADSNKAVKNA